MILPSPFETFGALRDGDHRGVKSPERGSFEEFLLKDARVPIGGGDYAPYSFEGREALIAVVRRIDKMIGSSGKPLEDSVLKLAGGAQFGKTILELNLAAYLTAKRFLNFGLYLPDDKLADGVIDTKFRPDVLDQIPWLAQMTQIGKAVTASGKSVNRKGAATVTDGKRRSNFMAAGLKRVPTTFSFDVTARDEEDDIPPKNAKFVRGRMTASKLRIQLIIGTQRVHGRGQNKAWKDGSQGVMLLGPATDNRFAPSDEIIYVPDGWMNPEEAFPQVVRCQLGEQPSIDDPKLTWVGDFKRDHSDATLATHKPGNIYYLADPETGAVLNRRCPIWMHRQPGRLEQDDASYRISQLGIAAIGLSQIMHQFAEYAVKDSDDMVVFRCDVLALPQSTTQSLTPAIIERSRGVDPFDMRHSGVGAHPRFAGLDTGDKCWFFSRERESASRKRLNYAASIAAADLMTRVPSLFENLGITALFIDQRPLVSEARSLAMRLNGISALVNWPKVPEGDSWITLPGGLSWDGRNQRWLGLKCAVVRFDKKQIGAGIEHGFDVFEEGGVTKFVPLIRCNRFETIDRAVREFLTPAENVVEVADGKIREFPAMLLPRKESAPAILAQVEDHIITGSERAKEKDGTAGDYVDECINHFLLADGYSALAENECDSGRLNFFPGKFVAFHPAKQSWALKRDRSCVGA